MTDKKPADLDVSTKEMESWFGMLDDTSKAEVMKAKIAADATTEQCRIKETEQTRRQTETDDDFLVTRTWTRVAFAAACVIAVALTTCEVDKSLAVKQAISEQQASVERAKLGVCPQPTVQAAAPPASAAPASSGK